MKKEQRIKTIKCSLAYLFLAFFVVGCSRTDTDPQPLFEEVKEEVAKRTSHSIYWDASIENSIEELRVENILQKKLTVNDVIQIALLNNKNLQALYEELGIAKADLVQAGLFTNPIFSLAYRFSTKPSVTDLIDMGLFQNFLEIFLIPLKKKMAKAEIEKAKSFLTAEIIHMIAETKIAFYSLVAAEKIAELKKEMLLTTELSFDAAKRLSAAGNITELELSMERSLYEQMKLELSSMEITVLEARERLNLLMGLWGREIAWKIMPSFPALPNEMKSLKNLENIAINNSIDLKVAYNNLHKIAAGYGIDTSKLIFPAFDIGVSSEREDSIWYVGPALNLPIPLFDFGQANSAKARSAILQEWNRYTALAVEIRSKARSAKFTLQNAYRQSRYLDMVIIPLAEEITHFTLLQHNAMQLGVFTLLTAKRSEIEKKIEAVEKRKEYLISRIILETLQQGHLFTQEGNRSMSRSWK